MSPSFAKPTLEYGNVLAFVWDIMLGELPATVIILSEWLTPSKVDVTREADMGVDLKRLTPRHPRLYEYTQSSERFSGPWVSLYPFYLVHQVMISPSVLLSNACNSIHAKADTMGIIQRVTPFMSWLRAATINPKQVIVAFNRMDLSNTTLNQRLGIRTIIVPPPPLHHQKKKGLPS